MAPGLLVLGVNVVGLAYVRGDRDPGVWQAQGLELTLAYRDPARILYRFLLSCLEVGELDRDKLEIADGPTRPPVRD